MAEASSKVQDGLADKYKLAEAKEFHIEGDVDDDQVLGCGVEVHNNPNMNRFWMRIYNCLQSRNLKNEGRTYIQLSLDDFLSIKRHEIIKNCFNYVRQDENIISQEDFTATVVPPNNFNQRPALKLYKRGYRVLYLQGKTFASSMTYEDTLKNEHAEFQRRNVEDLRFLDELANIVAFRRHEEKANDFVQKPAEWFGRGTATTWNKFVDQASKSKGKARMKAITSKKNQAVVPASHFTLFFLLLTLLFHPVCELASSFS